MPSEQAMKAIAERQRQEAWAFRNSKELSHYSKEAEKGWQQWIRSQLKLGLWRRD